MRIGIAYIEHGRDRGVERVSAEGALAAARAGHDVHYYCSQHAEAGHPNIKFHPIPVPISINSLRLAYFARAARKAIRRSTLDVTHSFGTVIGCDVLSAGSCHRAGMHATMSIPGQIRERANLGIADRVMLLFERENFAKRQYGIVVACSQRVKRELNQYYGVPDNDVVVIPNGVDLTAFQPDRCRAHRNEMREKCGILENDFLLLFVGHEFARKGLQTIIEAMGRLANPSIRLLVVGGGRPGVYRRLAKHLGILGQVTFAGHVKDMVPYYGAADLFVFPTLYEAFGLVITEAMASGLPVLVSASAGAAEDLIRDGQDGILITDPQDSIEVAAKIRMITHSWELRTNLSSLGRLRVLQTGWEQYGSQLLKVYDEVLARKK